MFVKGRHTWSRSTSSSNFMFLVWIRRISSRPVASGIPISTSRSNRPNRQVENQAYRTGLRKCTPCTGRKRQSTRERVIHQLLDTDRVCTTSKLLKIFFIKSLSPLLQSQSNHSKKPFPIEWDSGRQRKMLRNASAHGPARTGPKTLHNKDTPIAACIAKSLTH